jgi:hypothetical protein
VTRLDKKVLNSALETFEIWIYDELKFIEEYLPTRDIYKIFRSISYY